MRQLHAMADELPRIVQILEVESIEMFADRRYYFVVGMPNDVGAALK